ncbi:Polyadenylate-binding protein 4 [Nosema granulosis]|uniref:Polyadenylate-binding protein 4 n=1 Tax=Nosema granulosis TaxID=83296 RepID=A0A9P6L058_9MICR|nr:Polyadenylate-binding protein 4 [Nosema granulosis]
MASYKIIVSNLPPNFAEEDIRTLFSIYGDILRVSHHPQSNSYFVNFATKDECLEAVRSMNGRMIRSTPIYVDLAYDRDSKVYLYNIPLDSDLNDIQSFFSYYGAISSVVFKKNILQIVFEDKEDCTKLLELDNKIRYQGSLIGIKRSCKPGATSANNTVFVYNIHPSLTEQDFSNLFVKYGRVVSSGLLEGSKGFVNFEKEIGALKAVKYLDNKNIKGKKMKVALKTKNCKK